jgi:hypothetical protein
MAASCGQVELKDDAAGVAAPRPGEARSLTST